ncbi:MAG: hypothetical protein L0Z51_06560 [Candidatus Latescibacteria bacterium]|nr:hypothetical protein [Candidatus Latescibacterota bacterium]
MARRCNPAWLAAAIACLAIPIEANAEVLGPLLRERELEIGVLERHVDRLIDPDDGEPFQWKGEDYPVTIRYGLTASATLSFELSGDPNSMFFETDVVQYTVGAGIAALVWSRHDFALSTGIHYYRRLDAYREPGWKDYITRGIDWTFLGQQEFSIGRIDGSMWGGPTVSYLVVQPQAPWTEEDLVPESVVGGVIGLTLLSRIGIVLQGSFVWIDEPEYRLNLAYRF